MDGRSSLDMVHEGAREIKQKHQCGYKIFSTQGTWRCKWLFYCYKHKIERGMLEKVENIRVSTHFFVWKMFCGMNVEKFKTRESTI